MAVKLGDRVKDVITGLTGLAVAEHRYLYGCCRITVQPPIDKDGKVPEGYTFDEASLEVLLPEVVEKGDTTVGGPSKWEDTGR